MKKLVILLFSISYVMVSAQTRPFQPSILVLPYTSSGKSALDLYEKTPEYIAIIDGIEQVFIDRGAEVQDLQRTILDAGSKYKNIDDAINQNTSSEITVAAEIDYHNTGKYIQFGIRLKVIETSTGAVLYTGAFLMSPNFPCLYNLATLTTSLLTLPHPQKGVYIDPFIDGMQSAVKQMIKSGQEVTVIIKTDDDSNYLLNQEVNDEHEMISEKIDEWVASKAVNGNFRYDEISEKHLKQYYGLSDLAITPTVMKIRVPYRNLSSAGRFAKEFKRAILEICWQASKTMGSENKPDVSSMHVMIDRSTILFTMPAFR